MGEVIPLQRRPAGLVLSEGNLADLRDGLDVWRASAIPVVPGNSLTFEVEGHEFVLGVVEVLERERGAPLMRWRLLGEGELDGAAATCPPQNPTPSHLTRTREDDR